MNATAPLKAAPVGPADVASIKAIDDPVDRNRHITEAYHNLAISSSARLGGVNQTWCAFAAWASNEAGVTIRMDEFPHAVSERLKGSPDYHAAHNWLLRFLEDDTLLAVVADAARRTSAIMAAGNLQVFTDLGLAFANFSAGAALPPGQPDLIAKAFESYEAALEATDARRRAEWILLGNLQAVLYEQTTLENAIRAAIDCGVGATARAKAARHSVVGHFDRLLDDLEQGVEGAWQDAVTRCFATLPTPDGPLYLHQDVPAIGGQPLFPADLAQPQLPALVEFLARYDRTKGTGVASAARNWCVLEERMNYITNLFRSRQQDQRLVSVAPPGLPSAS